MRDVLKRAGGALFFGAVIVLFQFQICATRLEAQNADSDHPQRVKYFSLRHIAPDEMDDADRALLRSDQKELISEAQFYGYDLNGDGWTYDQTVCPALPSVLLLHYIVKFPDGSESLFTALVPREKGRIRIVPVLYRNASPYVPAIKNPRNFELFNSLVPEEIARKDSTPDGKWLTLAVCYAEVVGARPNVPDQPSLDVATIKAPVATYRYDATTQQRQIMFSDRDAVKVYTIWTISLNEHGRVTGAVNEDYATYAAHIIQPPLPPGTTVPAPPPSAVTPAAPEPPAKITPVPPAPRH